MSTERVTTPSTMSPPSTAESVNQTAGEISALVLDEIAPAKLEMGSSR